MTEQKKNNTEYDIMFKDIVVGKINTADGSASIENSFMPIDLNFKIAPQTIEDRVANVSAFKDWCASRTLMMSQKHAKKICNALNLSQDIGTENKAGIALAYHCSTLQDCYWVRQTGSELEYKDVSLFQNTFRNILTPVSLRGELGSVFTKKLKNWSDIGADGTLAKSWIREDGEYRLYKTGDNIDGEVLASDILSLMGANSIHYMKKEDEGLEVSVCPCFTNEDVSFMPYRTFAKALGLDAITYIKDNFLSEYANLVVATYLTGNEDLHDKNWGIAIDNNTGKISSLAPLFDFDGCFLYYESSKNMKFLPECIFVTEDGEKLAYNDWTMEDYEIEGPTIEEAALKYAKYATLDYKGLSLNVIPEKYRDEFERRVNTLERQISLMHEKDTEKDIVELD